MKVIARSVIAFVGSLAMVLAGMASAQANPGAGGVGARMVGGPLPTLAFETHDGIVSEVPADWTPQVLDGAVLEIAQVGDVIVVGGTFSQIAQTNTSAAIDQPGVFAFDATNGEIISGFDPVIASGDVLTVKPGPTAGTVYVGGSFSTINGVPRKVALLSTSTGEIVSGWNAPPMNGAVRDVILDDSRLYVGGTFTIVGGQSHLGLVTLDPVSGAGQAFLDVALTENQNWTSGSSGSRAPLGVKAMALSPDGTNLVVVGNFRKADGIDRRQVVLIDTTGATAEVDPNWRTDRYAPACFYWAFDSYMRDVAFAPDGQRFSIVTTGGHNAGTLCDTIATFDPEAQGQTNQPVWIDDTGGDTLLSVVNAGSTVYVGGHQRWLNNPSGSDTPKAGAVPRPGIAALSPINGLPVDWNPGRHPRGYGAEALTVTDAGLWVGSDTLWVGNYEYKRQRLSFFPSATGTDYLSTANQGLPSNVYTMNSSGGSTVSRFYFEGTAITDTPTPFSTSTVSWSTVRAATMIGEYLYYTTTASTLNRVHFDGTTFGTPVTLDPYNDPEWSTVTVSGNTTRTFRGLATSFETTDAKLLQGMFYDNGRIYYSRSSQSGIVSRMFQPDSGIVTQATLQVPGITGTNIGSLFLDADAGYLYYVDLSSGNLNRIGWVSGNGYTSGQVTGTPSVVSGPSVDGHNWAVERAFPGPGPLPNQAPVASFGSDCVGRDCAFDASESSDSDGSIASYDWDFGDGTTGTGESADHAYAEGGTYTVALTVTDDLGRTGTVSQSIDVAPGVAPTASFQVSCDQLTCSVDGSASSDPDGSALTYAWDFGDAATGTGATASHTFATAGTYTVALTVTDEHAMTGTVARDVSVSLLAAPALVGNSTSSQNASTAEVALPSGAEAGDMLILVGSFGFSDPVAAPTGAGTWSVVDDITSGSLRTVTWSKIADGSEAGTTVTVALARVMKSQLVALAYRGASQITAESAAFVNASTHTSPEVAVPGAPATAVTIWADRASAAITWSPPAGPSVIVNEVGAGGGRVSALVVDQAVSGSSYGGLVATSSTSTPRSTAVTVILTP